MSRSIAPLSERLRAHALGDDAFAEAYQAVPAHRRAWLKTAISRLYALYGPPEVVQESRAAMYRGGFTMRAHRRPRNSAVIFIGPGPTSPAKLLAAAVPAMVSGVVDIGVVRVGCRGNWEPAVLCAMELAGLEQGYDLAAAAAAALADELCDTQASGILLDLGSTLPNARPSLSMDYWRPAHGDRADIWLDGPGDVDLEILEFCCPDVAFHVWGTQLDITSDVFTSREGPFEVFLGEADQVAYVPDSRIELVQATALLSLGRGSESCWYWHDLPQRRFFQERITLRTERLS